LGAFAPIGYASPTEDNEGRLFIGRFCTKNLARLEAVHEEAHPFPLRFFAGQAKQFTGLAFRQLYGMDQEAIVAQGTRLRADEFGMYVLNVLNRNPRVAIMSTGNAIRL
jgi:hypothetical protein